MVVAAHLCKAACSAVTCSHPACGLLLLSRVSCGLTRRRFASRHGKWRLGLGLALWKSCLEWSLRPRMVHLGCFHVCILEFLLALPSCVSPTLEPTTHVFSVLVNPSAALFFNAGQRRLCRSIESVAAALPFCLWHKYCGWRLAGATAVDLLATRVWNQHQIMVVKRT